MKAIPFALIKYDLVLLARHGFVLAYGLIGILYAAIAGSLPPTWGDAVLPVLIWSDPVFFGFFFAGATLCLDLSQGTFRALVVTPLQPWTYILVKSMNLSLLAFGMALGMTFAVRGLDFRPLVLGISVLLGGAPAALLGAALALRLGTINRFMAGALPGLLWLSLPVLVYFGERWLPEEVLWLARLSPADGAFRWSQASLTGTVPNEPLGSLFFAALESLLWTGLIAKFVLAPAVAKVQEV